jgi:uncharacterized protein (TIGR02246 family)
MTTRTTLGLALCGAAALAVAQFSAAGRPVPDDKAKTAAPAEAKGARAAEFIAAFDKGDAKAVAAFWTPDGDYVDQLGRRYKGRAEIEKLYAKLFAANKGAKLTVAVTSVRAIGTDAAIEDGTTQVTPAGGGAPTTGTFTAVLVKKDGAWFFESVRETVTHPATNAEHFEELEWLLGDWEGEAGDKGASGVASYEWAENGNFIVSHFAATLDGEPVAGGTQWIGWDAADKQVRSWSFYSGGGFGEATWAKDKDAAKWTLKTTARTADGKTVGLANVITRVDADHMTWQPTQVTVDGKPVPDGPVVKMKRAK